MNPRKLSLDSNLGRGKEREKVSHRTGPCGMELGTGVTVHEGERVKEPSPEDGHGYITELTKTRTIELYT